MLWGKYDALILDLDGVVYIGDAAVPAAIAGITAASKFAKVAAATNNAARPPQLVARHLRELGLDIGDEEVVTSAQAGAAMLAELVPTGSKVLAVGGPGVDWALTEAGLQSMRAPKNWQELPDVIAEVSAVIQGHGTETGWWDLAAACFVIGQGKPWVATNRDSTVPTPYGFGPGNGSLVAACELATGRSPLVAGKPMPALFLQTTKRLGATRPLVVGDRLDTDVDGAIACGYDSLLVLTGVTAAADLADLPAERRPTYVAADLSCLAADRPPLG